MTLSLNTARQHDDDDDDDGDNVTMTLTIYNYDPHLYIIFRVSNDVTLSLNTARQHGIEKCVEKMLNFAEQLRRLKVG